MKLPTIKRMKLITDLLNDCEPHKISEIHKYVNNKMTIEYCKSQIEKDIFNLKMDFDMDEHYESSSYGIRLTKQFKFIDKLIEYLQ